MLWEPIPKLTFATANSPQQLQSWFVFYDHDICLMPLFCGKKHRNKRLTQSHRGLDQMIFLFKQWWFWCSMLIFGGVLVLGATKKHFGNYVVPFIGSQNCPSHQQPTINFGPQKQYYPPTCQAFGDRISYVHCNPFVINYKYILYIVLYNHNYHSFMYPKAYSVIYQNKWYIIIQTSGVKHDISQVLIITTTTIIITTT